MTTTHSFIIFFPTSTLCLCLPSTWDAFPSFQTSLHVPFSTTPQSWGDSTYISMCPFFCSCFCIQLQTQKGWGSVSDIFVSSTAVALHLIGKIHNWMTCGMNHASSCGWTEKGVPEPLSPYASLYYFLHHGCWKNLPQYFKWAPGERQGEHIAPDI